MKTIGPRGMLGARWYNLIAETYLAVSRAIVVSDCIALVSCDMPPMPVSAGAAISPVVSAGGASAAGFCSECGSSLFWDAPGRETISISAGTLDPPTGLRVASHWFVSQAGDYYELPDDGLPRHERSGEGELP